MCLVCGNRLTLCGLPFSLEIRCGKCNTVNIYRHYTQPIETRRVTDMDREIQKA